MEIGNPFFSLKQELRSRFLTKIQLKKKKSVESRRAQRERARQCTLRATTIIIFVSSLQTQACQVTTLWFSCVFLNQSVHAHDEFFDYFVPTMRQFEFIDSVRLCNLIFLQINYLTTRNALYSGLYMHFFTHMAISIIGNRPYKYYHYCLITYLIIVIIIVCKVLSPRFFFQ